MSDAVAASAQSSRNVQHPQLAERFDVAVDQPQAPVELWGY
jgi:hypothetical protein